MHDSPYLDVNEAAAYLGLARGTIYNLVHAGRLRCAKAGNRLRFRVEDLEGFLWGLGTMRGGSNAQAPKDS
jgi:excisionase family DNA binding protein